MPERKHLIWLWRLFLLLLACTAIWAGIRFVLPLVMPFLLGLLFARLLEKPVRALSRRVRMPRVLASAVLTVFMLGLLIAMVLFLGSILLSELNKFLISLPELMTKLPDLTGSWSRRIDIWIAAAPLSMQDFLRSVLDGVLGQSAAIPGQLYAWLAAFAGNLAAGTPKAVLFFMALVLSTFFISSDYPRLSVSFMRLFKPETREKILKVKEHLSITIGKWLKAQGILIFITFMILLLGMLLLRQDYALLIAAATAAMDALPILGVGLVLVPWAAVCLLSGETARGICLLLLFAVLTLTRGLMEPRLVGRQIGLPPLPTLISMYAGFLLWGVAGMILAPIATIMLKQMIDWGWIFPGLLGKNRR